MQDKQQIERITADVLSRIDREQFHAVKRKHSIDDGPGGASKYLDLERWIEINVRRALAIDLDCGRARRVLDIGTGCGYFPLVCKHLGHDAIALDCADRGPLFRDVAELLDVDVITYDVQPFVELPPVGAFDVIAAFMITFNGHRTDAVWGPDEWRYLLDDCETRLRSDGTLILELNREPGPNACYTPELESFFIERGARITGHWPHNPELGGHRLVFKR